MDLVRCESFLSKTALSVIFLPESYSPFWEMAGNCRPGKVKFLCNRRFPQGIFCDHPFVLPWTSIYDVAYAVGHIKRQSGCCVNKCDAQKQSIILSPDVLVYAHLWRNKRQRVQNLLLIIVTNVSRADFLC